MSGGALLGLVLLAASGEPFVEAKLEPAQITVGDHVQVTIEVTVPHGAAGEPPRFPPWATSWGEAEILDVAAVEEEPLDGGTLRLLQRLTLTAFRPGIVRLPSVQIHVSGEGAANVLETPSELGFEVRSLLAEEEGPVAPRPPEPARPLPVDELLWWTAGLLALGCLLAGAALAREARRAAGGAADKDPFDVCLERIRRAGGRQPTEGFTHLSWALRAYLAARLGIPALESTTPEIQRQVERLGTDPRWVHLLGRCDLAKFAGLDATAHHLAAACRQAQRLVDALEAATTASRGAES